MNRPATQQDKALDAEVRAGQWLAKGNEYAERGLRDKAEHCYFISTRWLEKFNKLTGRA